MLGIAAVAQVSSLLIGAVVMVAIGESLPDGSALWYSLGAGAVGSIGLLALYQALATGVMSIAAPISALSAVIPFAWGIASGESPAAFQLVGAAIALVGALLASREPAHAHIPRAQFRNSVILAAISALGIGTGLALLGMASSGEAVPVIVADRIATAGVILPLALLRRQMPDSGPKGWLPPVAVGAFDTGANVLYIAAFQQGGLMSIVGLLSSLYPITTVLLARFLLAERLERHQAAGVAIALTGVALVGAG